MPDPEKIAAGWVESWEKLLAQNLPFKIFLKGRDLTYLACNENYAIDHGLKPSEILGRSDYDLYPKELAERYRAEDLRILETGRSETIEGRYLKDGQEHHGQTIKSLFRDPSGEVIGILGTFWEITELVRVKEALQQSEERYAQINNSTPDYVVSYDSTGRITNANRAFCEAMGLSPDQVIGKTHADLGFPEDKCLEWAETIREAFETNEPVTTFTSTTQKDGSVRYFEVSLNSIHNSQGDRIGVNLISRNITERKRAEEALRESERKLKIIFDLLPMGVAVLDNERKIVYENPALRKIIQMDREDLHREKYKTRTYTHPDGTPMSADEFASVRAAREQKAIHNVETGIVLEDGKLIWTEVSAVPVALPDWKMVIFTVDITDRKRVEEALEDERNLFVAGPTSVFRWQPGLPWHVEYASPNVQELLGYPPEAFTSGSLSYVDIVHPDDIDRLVQEHTNHDRQAQAHYEQEYRLRRSDGQTLWVHDFTRTVIVNGSRQDHGYVTDITERKRAEEVLRESEEKYHSVFNNFIDLYYQTDMQGLITNLSPSCFILSGWKPEELIGHQVLEFYPDPEQRKALLEKLGREGAVSDYGITLLHRDGRRLSVSVSSHLIRDEQGNPKYVEGTIRDITDRKQAEEALRESESFNRGLVENVPDYIAIYGSDGKILHVNPASATVLGYSAEELVGTPVLSYVAEEYRHEVISRMTQRREVGEVLPYEIDLLTHGGLRRSVIVKGTQIQYRDLPATLLVLTDITERKQAEEALRESEEKHRAVVERANDGIVILQDDIIRFSNPNFAVLIGYETGDVEGMEFSRFIPEENLALMLERAQKKIAGKELSRVFETVLLHRSGKIIPVEVNSAVIQYEGKPADLVIMRDIRERKQIEGEMEKARADFLFGVSHELKTPLFLMNISLEMLENSPESGRAKRTTEFMETWKRNLHRLQHLVFNMVDSQRTQTMGFKLERQPTDFPALIEQVVQENKLLAEPKKIRITADLAPMPPLLIDPETIHRLVENLLTNAIKFSPRSGEVTVRLAEEDAQAVLTVKDRGPGIPAEEQKDLFLPFQRAATAVRSVIPGTGLGLYVAKIIVDAHGGTISMQSKAGQGTTITVRLPQQIK
jgi:PAS domain S-box-containing protein